MNNKITYHLEGDYLIPDLYLPEQTREDIGKYGRLKLKFIKENKRGLYTELMLNGTLNKYLSNINNAANKHLNDLIKRLALNENVDEKLKEYDQMEWVKCMNNIKNRAEEIILNELIYV